VVLVERDAVVFSSLEKTRALVGALQVELVPGDALEYLARGTEAFDVVFLDPPFGQNALPAVLDRLPVRLAPQARVYVEAERPVRDPAWRELRGARAGQVSYQLLERT
jgi:16S rRNA (guanine966-N2)-methyltransferase